MSFERHAGVLIIGQLVSKLFSFSLNQLLLLYTTPSALGISQLIEFVLDYTLFLSREAIRSSISKLSNDKNRLQWVINYSFLSCLIYILLGLPTLYWKVLKNETTRSTELYPFSSSDIFICIIACAFFELLAEPYYNINQYINLDINKRAQIEGIAGFSRCIFQFVSVLFISPQMHLSKYDVSAYVFGYCVGQLAYSFTIYICYLWSFKFSITSPKKISNLWIEPQSWFYFKSIFVQQIFKNFLTVGDKFLITSLLSIESQGKFSFISNYGSLIARILFAPMEESTRITVSRLFKSNEKSVREQDFKELERCLSNIVKLYVYLLTLLIIFAPMNTRFLLDLGFKNFSSEEIIQAFKLYWVYVVFLALNGILEALFHSLFSSEKAVNKYSAFIFFNTAVFFGTLVIFVGKLGLGLNGLLYSNLLNMTLRIGYCWINLYNYISDMEKTTKLVFSINLKSYMHFIIFSVLVFAFQLICFNGEIKSFKQFLASGICGIMLVLYIVYREILPNLIKKKAV